MDAPLRLARHFARLIERWDEVVVVGHHDADGITATALISLALERMGKEYKFVNLKQLYSDDIERLSDMGEAFIFVDFGAGQIEALRGLEKPFIIVDHHIAASDHPFLFHPSLFSLDGSKDVSGAGMAYLLARAMGLSKEWARLAVVGAVGDMQVRDGRLTGKINRSILRDAISSGSLFAYKDIVLYGRVSRPLPYLLLFSTEPILPGLTANEPGVMRFLEQAGIRLKEGDAWRAYVDLSQDERRRFFTALFRYLLRRGWSERRIGSLIGEVYDVTGEGAHSPLREVREFSTLLNAAGRHGRPEVGVHICMGDREKWYEEGLCLLRHHRRVLRQGIEWVLERGVERTQSVYYFHARHHIPSTVVGIVAGMVYGSGLIPTDMPIVAFAYEDDHTKVSARALSIHVRNGVNLGVALRKAAIEVGGEGGGHPPAAGARIPRGREEEFLEILDQIILSQISLSPSESKVSRNASASLP